MISLCDILEEEDGFTLSWIDVGIKLAMEQIYINCHCNLYNIVVITQLA